jgi:Animal haem peroxidase
MSENRKLRRVITNLRHGGHALSEDVYKADPHASAIETLTTVEMVIADPQPPDLTQISTPFGYLFDDLEDHYPGAHLPVEPASTVIAGLKALGSAMVEQNPAGTDTDSAMAPVYTYWGQFVDHDLTANTDREDDIGIVDAALEPLPPERVRRDLRNLRDPALNLDSLYGNGPAASGGDGEVPYDGDRFVLGELTEINAGPVPGADLPRKPDGGALVGDTRNDENLIVAQLHLAFLKFHNSVVDQIGEGDFERARQLVRWHYQWLCMHDFLKTIADPAVVDGLLDGSVTPFYEPRDGTAYMPLEFSVAAFRFGHSMVRGAYDWNRNFGAPGTSEQLATFGQLFQFTGGGGMAGLPTLPDNWPSEYERLTAFEPQVPGFPARAARKIDTLLAPPLSDLDNEGNGDLPPRIARLLKRLAVRNLVRGYRLAIPTGQAVAAALGVAPLSSAEILGSDQRVSDALIDGGFVKETPLWFYVLREAEVGGGDRLGAVGSRIVCETIIGQLRADPDSCLNSEEGVWSPADGVRLDLNGEQVEIDSIIRFLQFAGVHPVG